LTDPCRETRIRVAATGEAFTRISSSPHRRSISSVRFLAAAMIVPILGTP
jgi:hypothetical protein